MSASSKKVSVILPTYNERGNIVLLIENIHNCLDKLNHEIIVIDDSSPDGTFETVARLKRPYVKAIKRKEKPGLGYSIRCGIENTNAEIVVVMDSDGEHNPRYLQYMIWLLDEYGCVCTSRFIKGGGMKNKIHQGVSFIFNIFIRIVLKSCIRDNLYGYFAIKKEVLRQLDFDKIFFGYGDYYMRLLYYLQKNNAKIKEFGAVHGWRHYGKGKSKFLKTFVIYFKAVLSLARIEKRNV
jgi:dolichol-phosphate mannosyltransferase